jgi:hypothetical protein
MNRFCRPQGLTMWPITLALLWMAGCARPTALPSDDGTAHADHPVPFHDREGTTSAHQSGTQGQSNASEGQDQSLNPEMGLPFHDSQNLPAGTLITVRLNHPISAESLGKDGIFEAVVDEPVEIEGYRLIPRGTTVAGRVESTHSSSVKGNRGYVRLALDSIHLAGVNLPIQTSSLFVREKGDAHAPASEVQRTGASTAAIHLEKGRRLTFRLTERAYVSASQRTPIDR